MNKGRLEAFSDGVIAIIITIMVLELRPPEGIDLAALGPLVPVLLGYVLSFVFIAIYWNNHHHLLQAARHVDGRILWANVHLLFWLSLVPFATNWMSGSHFERLPTAVYGVVLLLSGVAYYVLTLTLIARHGLDSALAKALGADVKGKVSLVIYGIAIGAAFLSPALACALYILVAVMWLVPDTRIAKALAD